MGRRAWPLVSTPPSQTHLNAQAPLPSASSVQVFRFVTEALTLPEASGRIFSLCPSETAATALREMRFRGYDRRDEVKALLGGAIAEEAPPAEVAAATAEMGEAETAVEQKTEAEVLPDPASSASPSTFNTVCLQRDLSPFTATHTSSRPAPPPPPAPRHPRAAATLTHPLAPRTRPTARRGSRCSSSARGSAASKPRRR